MRPCSHPGGDLPNTPPVLAGEVMERLRQELSGVRSPLAPDLKITLSIGLASYSPFQLDATHWLKVADQALYQAKHRGRDQVVTANEALGATHEEPQGLQDA